MRESPQFAVLINVFGSMLCIASLTIWFLAYNDWTTLHGLQLANSGGTDVEIQKNQAYLESSGLIGDSFGKYNFAVSSLALLGVALSVFFQSFQLRLQKEESAAARVELEEQKAYLNRQNIVLQRQSFETSFYNQLNLFIRIREAIEFHYQEPVYSESPGTPVQYMERSFVGSAAFQMMFTKLEGQLKHLGKADAQTIRMHIQKYFELNGNFNELNIDQYFRVLGNFLGLIDETSVGEYNDRMRYFTILRSIFFEAEFSLILLYGLTEKGQRIFALLAKYGLAHGYTLQNLRGVAEDLFSESYEFL